MIIILTFIAFTGLVALISWYKTKEENLSTKEGYFLAGRGLTGLVIAGSLEMTNLSTEQLVGQAGQSYSTNMGAMSWSVNASIALLALALIFLPKYLKAGITTIPEFLEVRFDRTTKQIISFLFLLGYMLTYLPTVLYSGALAFNQIFHLDQLFGITTYQSIAILCVAIGVIGSIYAIFGGLKAVAVSDTVNGVGLLIGGLLIPILSICILGNGSFLAGIQDFITNVPAEKFNAVNPANALPPMIPCRSCSSACCSTTCSTGAPTSPSSSARWQQRIWRRHSAAQCSPPSSSCWIRSSSPSAVCWLTASSETAWQTATWHIRL